uniref:Uncharacterized protein n=1 Tax=Arundo donax TaxID=35708 RepID=A0A0A9A853_ARUDO
MMFIVSRIVIPNCFVQEILLRWVIRSRDIFEVLHNLNLTLILASSVYNIIMNK